jgi:group I intron endonuclease
MIRNKLDGKKYIGSAAKDLRRRWKNHLSELRRGEHPNIHLQRAFNRDGEGNFEFVIIEFCPPEKCVEREQWWIDHTQSAVLGYNFNPRAGSRIGTKHSEETKEKIRRTKLGTVMSEEARARMSASRTGKKMSPERKAQWLANHWTKRPDAKEIAARAAAKRTEAARKKFEEIMKSHRQWLEEHGMLEDDECL